ncbi:probable CAIB/BAIF family enzyme [Phialocephala subalpina]|uniref:Probable CAIB/BAIF family enzyme n=1 Tax=Phialocephala subalpina TaxID=576137 RepID=A0A1L7XTF5_9HELO|nr:probable CAIB/BAIF family enzyme [Phialocephala subalpina]
MSPTYSPLLEAQRILQYLCQQAGALGLPESLQDVAAQVKFVSDYDHVYFPIPFKETETAAALKAVEGSVACLLADLKQGKQERVLSVSLEKTTNFLFQAYLATVDGLGKLEPAVKSKLKDTDYLRAQSDPYRRMSANLYETKRAGEFYHIHGSLEASTTLNMLGLESFRPDLNEHGKIVSVIEPAVRKFTIEQLEELNARNKQAGVPVLRHEDFLKTPHGVSSVNSPTWSVTSLETSTPPVLLPPSSSSRSRILEGIKVLELCRIIAGPTIGRILAEYGANVLKVTGPGLSDVPFFQVDGNMGKHATEIDLKSVQGKEIFERLLEDVDIVLDGYRPGALDKLGYSAKALAKFAEKRGKGVVYVNENCFGYAGEWANRPGWQQIADCVSGLAWAQGRFLGLDEPVVPPFPISDYGTGCIGAITALTGLYNRATKGGSWHGKASLLQYDLLLFKAGQYSREVQKQLQAPCSAAFLSMRHDRSVDDISRSALAMVQMDHPELFQDSNFETWYSEGYGADVRVVKPVVDISGIEIGFQRGSRPNGTDEASWDFSNDGDFRR